MTELGNRELLKRCWAWVKANECPLPLDLATELMEAGIDPEAIESQLLG